jgi:hypothetical protein
VAIVEHSTPQVAGVSSEKDAMTPLIQWRARGRACADLLRCEDPETLLAVASAEGLPVEVVLDVVARGILTHPLYLELVAGDDWASTRARLATCSVIAL